MLRKEDGKSCARSMMFVLLVREYKQWFRRAKNRNLSTGPLARPFDRTAYSFACSTLHRSFVPLRSSVRSLA